MALNIEFLWDESVTLGEIEAFAAQARASGADSGTALEAVMLPQDDSVQLGWRVTSTGAPAETSRGVEMPHRLMWNLHSLLEQIGSGDGDVRQLQSEVIDLDAALWEALMKHVGDQ
ncbi:hypothetical protein [Streptomyces sp. NPDC051286]|uniref:hypothetical protein n=1 Tax=Streptomyces sp. NPDC051286 TaxID=3365647 RepID=UPI003789091A